MKSIPQHLRLENSRVLLETLNKAHLEHLQGVASTPAIWEHYVYDVGKPEVFHTCYKEAFISMKAGAEHCFVIIDKSQNRLAGSTRFLGLDLRHKKLEIGWTWMHPDFWGTGLNEHCKWLLLNYCFEKLNMVRVQFRTDENNRRSATAIEKLGARFEGIVRNDYIRDNGTLRNSPVYSILHSEWPQVKSQLETRIKASGPQ